MATTQKRVVHRDSGSGEFVTKKFADNHKGTTEKQHITVPAKTTKPKK